MSPIFQNLTKNFDHFCNEWSLVIPQDEEGPCYFEDLDKALEACEQDAERLWTVVSGDDGSAWVSTGNRLVNRMHMYFVTEEKHNFNSPDYMYWEPDETDENEE